METDITKIVLIEKMTKRRKESKRGKAGRQTTYWGALSVRETSKERHCYQGEVILGDLRAGQTGESLMHMGTNHDLGRLGCDE